MHTWDDPPRVRQPYQPREWPSVADVSPAVLDMRARVARRRQGPDLVKAIAWWLALVICVGCWVGLWMAGLFFLALGLAIVGVGCVVVYAGVTGYGS